MIEQITDEGSLLALIIRADATSDRSEFFTPDQATFQAGFVVYPGGGRVAAHAHLPVERQIVGTAELLIVRSGRCFVDVYSVNRHHVASRELQAGDAVLAFEGGHGFRMIEDTVLFEVKQGPFGGVGEKERFDTGPNGETL